MMELSSSLEQAHRIFDRIVDGEAPPFLEGSTRHFIPNGVTCRPYDVDRDDVREGR